MTLLMQEAVGILVVANEKFDDGWTDNKSTDNE